MENLKERSLKKYTKAIDAVQSLRLAIDGMNKVDSIAKSSKEYPEFIYRTFRDSLIQRFEYSFDQTWKYLNDYLESQGRKIEIQTPKSVFREGFKANILSEETTRQAIEMTDHRNLTTHGYNEKLVEEISQQVPKYYNLMNNILNKTKLKPNF
ncbi:MAG: Nucleotidyltransferase substrate binding protein, HI0074 family [candidate division TM6 bacterium GW2011_GWF2_37_49]|nr:MAG: Nucleotidyltransferase substrate binding protein, HI0074 family [candidate division TM6 bacterium GW2011_GWF2_37_49]